MSELIEEKWVDRTDWDSGPWDDEPDRIEWRSQGMPCLIVRNGSGALCGYVGVPPGHPWHGKGYDYADASVHGGLTYADKCQAGGHICHVARPGEPDDVWWLGFDCAHSGDVSPKYTALAKKNPIFTPGRNERYRDARFVRGEVESLARQALAATASG